MDFIALSLQKLNREKRERQPNWTEPEKQLLLSLTQMHKAILENKGSDTMTIKRKSEVWDEIAVRMKAAGFNRSKERLKQQLGRIRAADAKKIKDAMEKYLTAEQSASLNDSGNHSLCDENVKPLRPQLNDDQIKHSFSYTSSLTTLSLQGNQYIKSEHTPLIEEIDHSQKAVPKNSSAFIKPNVINYSMRNGGKNKIIGENCKLLDNMMHFQVQNVQSLAENHNNNVAETIDNCCIAEPRGICASDVTSTMPCSTVSSNIEASARNFDSIQISKSGNDENGICCQIQKRRQRRLRSLRSGRMRTSFKKENGLRQLYMYRIAVERERLRSVRLQQRRDRILYRKDIEIQNLKLQILRNLTNQNREANTINF